MSTATSSTAGIQRHSASSPCPVCNGYDDTRLKDKRCYGFTSGNWIHCTRIAEGSKKFHPKSSTWSHHHPDYVAPTRRRSTNSKPSQPQTPVLASPEKLHEVYTALLEWLTLSDEDRYSLTKRGLDNEAIDFNQYRSYGIKNRRELADEFVKLFGRDVVLSVPGFIAKGLTGITMKGSAGILIPVRNGDKIRALVTRSSDVASGSRYTYISSAKPKEGSDEIAGPGPGSPAHIPKAVEGDHEVWTITEGQLKADVYFHLSNNPVVAMPGVGRWKSAVDLAVKRGAKTIQLAFDADARTNKTVARHLLDCATYIVENEIRLIFLTWDVEKGKGIDDLYAAGHSPSYLTDDEAMAAIRELADKAGVEPETFKIHQPGLDEEAEECCKRLAQRKSSRSHLPEIILDLDQSLTINLAEQSLWDEPSVFTRSNSIVRCLPLTSGRKKADPERPPGTPQISPVARATLSEIMSRSAAYYREASDGEGGSELKPCLPPSWAVAGLESRGQYPSLRCLEGVIECPTIRQDGSILDAPGWDYDTGLLYLPNANFESIPDQPAREDARAAVMILFELVSDFPFKDDSHKAVWLAGLLTVIARFAIDDQVPMFLFDANNRGSGKTLLTDLISMIATGRGMARRTYPEDDAEMRKSLTAIAQGGDRTVLFDNVPTGGSIGCSSLDVVLTSRFWTDRILGGNKNITVLWWAVIFGSGNNLLVAADTARRTMFSRLETPEIRPEEREDFKVPNLLEHTRKNRGRLVSAALTILRAHAVAGYPKPDGLVAMDFREWCRVVRYSIAWACGIDPAGTRKDLQANDQDTLTIDTLTAGWIALCQSEGKPKGLTVSEALKAVQAKAAKHESLSELLTSWTRDGKYPSPVSAGKRMRKYLGRPSKNGTLLHATDSGLNNWYVKPPASGFKNDVSGDSGDSGGNSSSFAGESKQTYTRDPFSTPPAESVWAESVSSPLSPPPPFVDADYEEGEI